jgi:tryptophan 7-halogenase
VQDADRDAYNRLATFEIERIRDFVILHYVANGRHGEPFWDSLRQMEAEGQLPEALGERMAMFRASGRIVREHDELFDVPGWVQVMIGQGVKPERWHTLADQVAPESLSAFLDTVRSAYAKDVARMPSHADYVAHVCGKVPAHA